MPKDNNAAVRSRRLTDEEIARNFSDMHPPLGRAEALVEADRCYFCFDAPCTTACPTGIDIPGFIQKIRSDNIPYSTHTTVLLPLCSYHSLSIHTNTYTNPFLSTLK